LVVLFDNVILGIREYHTKLPPEFMRVVDGGMGFPFHLSENMVIEKLRREVPIKVVRELHIGVDLTVQKDAPGGAGHVIAPSLKFSQRLKFIPVNDFEARMPLHVVNAGGVNRPGSVDKGIGLRRVQSYRGGPCPPVVGGTGNLLLDRRETRLVPEIGREPKTAASELAGGGEREETGIDVLIDRFLTLLLPLTLVITLTSATGSRSYLLPVVVFQTVVSAGRVVTGIETELHFVDEWCLSILSPEWGPARPRCLVEKQTRVEIPELQEVRFPALIAHEPRLAVDGKEVRTGVVLTRRKCETGTADPLLPNFIEARVGLEEDIVAVYKNRELILGETAAGVLFEGEPVCSEVD
jgi:hypothetical protein